MSLGYSIRLDSFLGFINSSRLEDDEKNFVYEQLYSKDSVSRMHRKNCLIDQKSINQFYEFIKYLHEKSEQLGVEYLRDAVKYACKFKQDNNDFLDQFIKFVVITNFDEIELLDNIDSSNKESMGIVAYLGGLEVSHNTSVYYNEEKNLVECEWFHNRAGLNRTKIGSLMMREFFKRVESSFPGASIFSDNVKRDNESALSFYRKIGFKVFDYNPESPCVGVEIGPQQMHDSIMNLEGLYPKIELGDRVIDFTTYKSINRGSIKH